MIVRWLIIDSINILLIHRYHNNQEYYVLPGGHIEKNESEEVALLREIKEETSLDAEIDRKLWTMENPQDNSHHHFFLIKEFFGTLLLWWEELGKNSENNQYILERHDGDSLDTLNIVPKELKQKILSFFRD